MSRNLRKSVQMYGHLSRNNWVRIFRFYVTFGYKIPKGRLTLGLASLDLKQVQAMIVIGHLGIGNRLFLVLHLCGFS